MHQMMHKNADAMLCEQMNNEWIPTEMLYVAWYFEVLCVTFLEQFLHQEYFHHDVGVNGQICPNFRGNYFQHFFLLRHSVMFTVRSSLFGVDCIVL